MSLAETTVWFLMPIVLSLAIVAFTRKPEWASYKTLLPVNFGLGLTGPVLAPTAMCANSCNNVIVAFYMSFAINSVALLLVTLTLYRCFRKTP